MKIISSYAVAQLSLHDLVVLLQFNLYVSTLHFSRSITLLILFMRSQSFIIIVYV